MADTIKKSWYNDVNTQLASMVKSVNGNTPDSNGNLTLEQLGYLPLSGGTMTGNINFSNNGKVAEIYTTAADSSDWSYVALVANGSGLGGSFQAFMENSPNHAGGFTCRAELSNGVFCDLYGTPEGLLQWGGKNIVRTVNGLETTSSGEVTLFSSGFWGDEVSGGWWMRFTNNIQIINITYYNAYTGQDIYITFPLPFIHEGYSSVITPNFSGTQFNHHDGVINKSTTGCMYQSMHGEGTYHTSVSGIFMGWWR